MTPWGHRPPAALLGSFGKICPLSSVIHTPRSTACSPCVSKWDKGGEIAWDDKSKTEIQVTAYWYWSVVMKYNKGQTGWLYLPKEGEEGKKLKEAPSGYLDGQGATHPRGIITSDLHSLKIRNRLVGRRGRNVLINVGQFGERCFTLWNRQINSLPSTKMLFSGFEIRK